jgi:hypothetical protein
VPVNKAPTKQDDKTRERESHKVESRDRNHDEDQRRSNNRHKDDYGARAWDERHSPKDNVVSDREQIQ